MRPQAFALLVIAALAMAGPAGAGAFYLQEQAVRGTGRAYSGEAADTGPASLWWNPAAIAGAPRQAYIGAHAVLVESQVVDAGSTLQRPGRPAAPFAGEPRAHNPIASGLAPNLAVSAPVGDRLALGLSLAAPYNFTTRYRPGAWARYDALESRLSSADLQFTAAVQVTRQLALGAAVSAQYADAKLSNALPNLSPDLPDGVSQLRGDGLALGWSVGAQARLGRATLGASFRAPVSHRLKGRVFVDGLQGPLAIGNGQGRASAHFTTPWIATVAGRWAVTDRLTLNLQAQRHGWSEFDDISIRTTGGRETLVQDYHDVTSLAAGLDYALKPGLTLRAGVGRDPTPTPRAARSARVPDGDRWFLAAGATVSLPGRAELDVAAAYIAFDGTPLAHRTEFYEGGPAAVTTQLAGRVEGEGLILSMGLRTPF